jgi:hypothetical protein
VSVGQAERTWPGGAVCLQAEVETARPSRSNLRRRGTKIIAKLWFRSEEAGEGKQAANRNAAVPYSFDSPTDRRAENDEAMSEYRRASSE